MISSYSYVYSFICFYLLFNIFFSFFNLCFSLLYPKLLFVSWWMLKRYFLIYFHYNYLLLFFLIIVDSLWMVLFIAWNYFFFFFMENWKIPLVIEVGFGKRDVFLLSCFRSSFSAAAVIITQSHELNVFLHETIDGTAFVSFTTNPFPAFVTLI